MNRGGATILTRLGRLGAVFLLAAGIPAPAAAPPSDMAVKAAFLTKFPGYLDWPAAVEPPAGAPIQICVVGGDPFGRLLDEAARGQQIDRHPLQVRRFADPAAARGCHLAFVQGSGAAGTAALLQGLQGRPIVTVTDSRAGSQEGMIHFVLHQGRVRFNIDEAQAARNGVAVSSRLLRIALTVRQRR